MDKRSEPLNNGSLQPEDCTDWGPPPADEIATGDNVSLTPVEGGARRKNMLIAIGTMILAVPALIGSWCWPIFLGVIVGLLSGQSFDKAAANASSHEHTVAFFHGLQVAIMMTVMLNIVQYSYWTVLTKRRNVVGHWAKFGPCYILLVASVLVCTQPMCILVIGSWSINTDAQCAADPKSWPCTNVFWTEDATNTFFPNRPGGWMIQIFCTWFGFLLMMIGVVQATELHKKMARTWRTARGQA